MKKRARKIIEFRPKIAKKSVASEAIHRYIASALSRADKTPKGESTITWQQAR
jgi:hypothetical protein